MTRKLKLKDSIYVLKESEEVYSVLFTGTRKIKQFQVDPLIKKVIAELESEQTKEELLSKLRINYNEEQIIHDCLQALMHEGIIREYEPKEESERYARQISFIDELTSSSG